MKRSTSRPNAAAIVNHTGKAGTSWFSNVVPRLLQLSPWHVVVLGACFYTFWCVLFGGLYYLLGPECYSFSDSFDFAESVWLSVHTFSTVGYGSIYPTCIAGQLLVMAESFTALIVTSVMGGRILFEVMRPRARVRFSNVVLLDKDKGGNAVLTFRMARECGSLLRDATLEVQARLIATGPDGKTLGRRETLQLRSSSFNQLEQWQVYHVIDEGSPLYSHLDRIGDVLSGLEVSLVAFDTSYMQEVRLYASYRHCEFVMHARFVDMLTARDVDGQRVVTIDHTKLDAFELHAPPPHPTRALTFLQRLRRSTNRSLGAKSCSTVSRGEQIRQPTSKSLCRGASRGVVSAGSSASPVTHERSAKQSKDAGPMLGAPPRAAPEPKPQPWDGGLAVPKPRGSRNPLVEFTQCNLPSFAPLGTTWRVMSNTNTEAVEPHEGERDMNGRSAPF